MRKRSRGFGLRKDIMKRFPLCGPTRDTVSMPGMAVLVLVGTGSPNASRTGFWDRGTSLRAENDFERNQSEAEEDPDRDRDGRSEPPLLRLSPLALLLILFHSRNPGVTAECFPA
ncbi:MAG: hypothetical protein ACE5F1_05340 [Planctomycetota bacterium]